MSQHLRPCAFAALLLLAAAPAARAAEALTEAEQARHDAFADEARLRATANRSLTNVGASVEAIRQRAALPTTPPATPAAPAPKAARTTLAHSSPPPAIAVIDATCTGGALACPATLQDQWGSMKVYDVDMFAASTRFFQQFPDSATAGWDMVVSFSTFVTTSAGGAYYMPIANEIKGISRTYMSTKGGEVYDLNRIGRSGSGGFLRGAVLMSEWHKCLAARSFQFPCDNAIPWKTDQNGIIGILGQEVGHRWGAFLRFADGNRKSDALLGRSLQHWSYYADTGGSPLEGNHWVRDGAAFKLEPTTFANYSPLDLYTMGLLPPALVPPTLVVEQVSPAPCTTNKEDAQVFSRCRTNASTPPGDGTRRISGVGRDVTIDEVIAAEGDRTPGFPDAPRMVHLAWMLMEIDTMHATDAEMLQLDSLRRAFTRYFYDATDRRMRAISTLTRRDDMGLFDFTLDEEGFFTTGAAPTREFEGRLSVRPEGDEVFATHDKLELDAAREKYMHLKIAFSGPVSGPAQLNWWIDGTPGPDAAQAIDLPMQTDGRFRTLQIPVGDREGWVGTIQGLSLRLATGSTGPGAQVDIESIEFASEPLFSDLDGDFLIDDEDNCPTAWNPDQVDTDNDGPGDACDAMKTDEGGGGEVPPDGCGCTTTPMGLLLLAPLMLLTRGRRRAAQENR